MSSEFSFATDESGGVEKLSESEQSKANLYAQTALLGQESLLLEENVNVRLYDIGFTSWGAASPEEEEEEEEKELVSGTCGDNLTWSLKKNSYGEHIL